MTKDSTQRFSDRVENYAKYRPSYPRDVVSVLATHSGLTPDSVIADIGSGTGILSRMLLENGNRVLAVEPNAPMREAAEALLAANPRFTSIGATAEDTRIASGTVDMITVAQAFHWFDRDRAREEFLRILKPGGWCVLIWNERKADASPFSRAYETIIKKYSSDYARVGHRNITHAVIDAFYAPEQPTCVTLPNRQEFDFEGVHGRLLSSSYMPNEDSEHYPSVVADLREAFEQHQQNGCVVFEYDTVVHLGRLPRVGASDDPV